MVVHGASTCQDALAGAVKTMTLMSLFPGRLDSSLVNSLTPSSNMATLQVMFGQYLLGRSAW